MDSGAVLNPLTHMVDVERALFNGLLAGPAVWQGALAAAAVAAHGPFVGVRAMRNSI